MSSALPVDCHLHTAYSGHGEGSVAQVVEAALEKGLEAIALTEHLTLPDGLDPKFEDSMSSEEAILYIEEVECQRALHPEIEIVLGCEADWLGNEDYLREAIKPYDYVLLSVHFIDGWGMDNPDAMEGWEQRGVDAVWESYLKLWTQAASSGLDFACMSHPDLPKKFALMPSFPLCEYYREMAECAAENGRRVEVNSSGLRNPCKELYPSLDLLKEFCRLGVPCTFGSDAHVPSLVGFGAEKARFSLLAAGYNQVFAPLSDGSLRTFEI